MAPVKRASVLASLLLASCALDVGESSGIPCGVNDLCPEDSTCYRGFCISTGGGECATEGLEVDCYSGPEGTVGIGACRPGTRTCRSYRLSGCRGEIVPGLEVCNAEDDDCDGRVDEIAANGSCTTALLGACAEGTTTCVGSSATCVAIVTAHDETCDATDDDCDGRIDEATSHDCYPDAVAGCAPIEGGYACTGSCAAGHIECVDGAPSACTGAVLPSSEDGCTPAGAAATDDDCDGRTDEDCACVVGSTQSCYDGAPGTAGVGPCRAGAQTCEGVGAGSRYGDCVGARAPTTETCTNTGVDDDCNGRLDDVPGAGDACAGTGTVGACREGHRACSGGVLVCVATPASPEACNARDDDCDGATDEGFDLLTDTANCGSCGHACDAGDACCRGACVDLATTATHCGACTTACGAGIDCCAGACADLETSMTDCGACGHTCGATESCRAGVCCGTGGLVCRGACVDPRVDEMNCGACGVACRGNETCTMGCCCRADGHCHCA
jgi:hypothetical protein